MRYISILSFILVILLSCSSSEEKSEEQVSFSTRHILLSSDTTIRSIAYNNGYLLLLQDNGRFLVLDSVYKRVGNLENNLALISADFLVRYNDTVFVRGNDKDYYLNKDFKPIEYNFNRKIYGEVLFEDSSYLVYGCCAGEWGGSVFFQNKRTKRTYSYFATCANQVLRFQNEYIVCNNLAHLSEYMSFLVVKDPETLYEITEDSLKNHCNWYTEIDSLKEYWQVSKVGKVRFYSAYGAMSLVTFPFGDSLYSILSSSKATVLAVHRGNTTITKETLIKNKISFHQTQVIEGGKKKICLYRLTEGSPFAAYRIRGNTTGLIVVEGNRIDFLDSRRE